MRTVDGVKLPFLRRRESAKERAQRVMHDVPKYFFIYVTSLFPIATWIHRYNFTWLIGDVIAGFTAGSVVIPQGLAYAKLATLPAEYGLYNAFVGVSIYCLFATSKDITIGPTAVMSLLIGQTITKLKEDQGSTYENVDLAIAFSLVSGLISLLMGLFRLGIVVDFIPGTVICGFCTGSALTIAIGQIAKLFGIEGVKNTDATFEVLGQTLSKLGTSKWRDMLFGFFSLAYLYSLKYGTAYAAKRWPRWNRVCFFVRILRNITCVILATFFAWVITRDKENPPISIIEDVPKGFNHLGVPFIDRGLLKDIGSSIPSVTLILVLEHVAIAKSFGRINNYKINPSQEMIAIGATNALGSFFGGYPATGSFSRTAIKSKSGVRTPLAGIFSGILVILALFVLTPAFFYIPNATLGAVIIHAVLDLISSPAYIKHLWHISFWDFAVFASSVIATVFIDVEHGIYISTSLALLILLIRIARPRFEALGRLTLEGSTRELRKHAYVPLDHPSFTSAQPPPGDVVIVRLNESLTYPNSNYMDDLVINYAKERTRRCYECRKSKGDRPWNDAGVEETKAAEADNTKKPTLRAVIFDMSSISVIDSSGLQCLADIKKELNSYANRKVEYHFANLKNESIQRALIIGGFGTVDAESHFHGTEVSVTLNPKQDDVEPQEIDDNNQQSTTYPKRLFHLTLEEAIAEVTPDW